MRRIGKQQQEEDNLHDNSSTSSSSSTDSNLYDCHFYRHHHHHHHHHHQDVKNNDLSTDLKLGLSISSPRGQYSDWPPIKPLLRSTLEISSNGRRETLYVKVYMEGIPIGRKLDLLAHDGYHSLITTLVQMFRTTILSPDFICNNSTDNCRILTYEDKEGDWMMVGDVPWEMFLTTVKRLKIATMEKCQAC